MNSLDRLREREKRLRSKLRKLKAERRRQDKQAELMANARLGALVRREHPALAALLEDRK